MPDDLDPPAAPGEKLSLAEMIDRSKSFREKFFDDLCKEDSTPTFVRITTPCPSCTRRDKKCPAKTVIDETIKRLEKGGITMAGEIRCGGYDEED